MCVFFFFSLSLSLAHKGGEERYRGMEIRVRIRSWKRGEEKKEEEEKGETGTGGRPNWAQLPLLLSDGSAKVISE